MIDNVLLNFKQGQLADTRENINVLISKIADLPSAPTITVKYAKPSSGITFSNFRIDKLALCADIPPECSDPLSAEIHMQGTMDIYHQIDSEPMELTENYPWSEEFLAERCEFVKQVQVRIDGQAQCPTFTVDNETFFTIRGEVDEGEGEIGWIIYETPLYTRQATFTASCDLAPYTPIEVVSIDGIEFAPQVVPVIMSQIHENRVRIAGLEN